jgi:flagellar hook-length control protein FliK
LALATQDAAAKSALPGSQSQSQPSTSEQNANALAPTSSSPHGAGVASAKSGGASFTAGGAHLTAEEAPEPAGSGTATAGQPQTTAPMHAGSDRGTQAPTAAGQSVTTLAELSSAGTGADTPVAAGVGAGASAPSEVGASAGTSAFAETGSLSAPGVPLQEMIDSIGATIELATRQGIAKARIELHPEELGHISIRLSQTSEGLRARVTADTPAGAQALTQGRGELRQTLSSMGLSLLRLDIGSSGQPQTGEQNERWTGKADGSNLTDATNAPEERADLGEPQDTRPLGAPLGEIVDVLA